MPRPTATEKLYDEAAYRGRSAWPAILLASPLGLLIAMIVVSEIRTSAPAVVDAEAAGIVSVPESLARPQPVVVPAAIGPAAGTSHSPMESAREGRTVPAARLQALINDPTVRDFKGLSENAWDFSQPAGVPGFGPYRGADDKSEPGSFKLTADE
jgi:hypothetical protein